MPMENVENTRESNPVMEPKTDCFAYRHSTSRPDCRALNELYCARENCAFYKPKNSANTHNN